MTNASLNPGDPVSNLAIGTIIEIDGSHVVAELDSQITELTRVFGGVIYPIGQFGSIVRIHFGRRIIYGYVSRLRMKDEYDREKGIAVNSNSKSRIIEADLFGEGTWIKTVSGWNLEFERGVSTFPLPHQAIYLTPRSELKFVFGEGGTAGIKLGEHVGSGGTAAYANLDELLGKHTAILGSTGAGKSGTVAAILHSILDHKADGEWNPQIVILDPHNEYGDAFNNHKRLSSDEGSLTLPYWLLDLNETVELLVGKTEFAATSQSNIVKNALRAIREHSASSLGIEPTSITVDSPIPYELGDPTGLDDFGKIDGELYDVGFVGAINALRPDNRNRKDHEDFNKVLRKLNSLMRDSRMNFLMAPWESGSDPLPEILEQFIGEGEPIRIVDLSGVPNEVAGAATAAIARVLFAVKLWQTPDERKASPVLLVCEEAHRYVPDRGEALYSAAQEAVRRLAKEGRKYGLGILLVSQRPSEVEATVLSQCNSWIVLRITNDADRSHVKAILPDSLAGLTNVLSGLRRREAIFVGQAALLPSRIMIRELDSDQLPRSHDIRFHLGWSQQAVSKEHLKSVASRWRHQQREHASEDRHD